jgi:hypothetical protein
MSSLVNAHTEEDLQTPTIPECSALVDRIAASSQFRRSARLRDFLIYVGRQSLKDGAADIHEQDIGVHVFGRPVSYDRSQDNIVRVNATELRKRIDQYFITEGAHETVLMEIPRGGYRPVFRRRSAVAPVALARIDSAAVEPVSPATTPARRARRGIPRFIWAACTVILAALCVYLFLQNRSLRTSSAIPAHKSTVQSFWQQFQQTNTTTDIVLPDDSLSLIEDLINRPVSLEDYLSRNFMRQVEASDLSADRKYDANQIFAHNLITFGGVRAAEEMMPYLPEPSSTHLTLSRYYEGDAIKQHNVILVGGKKANPWVHLFDDQINFVTDYDNIRGQALVINRQPKPGEQSDYRVSFAPNALIGYSAIAYLPNPSHTGNAVILAGTDSDATSAAAEFLTSETQLRQFENMLHVQKLPYFEVLLKTSRLSGTSLSAEVLAYRTYPELH